MNQNISSTIQTVKSAAKRLKKFLPNTPYMQRLDVATYAFSGKQSFHILQSEAKNHAPEPDQLDSYEDFGDEPNEITIKPMFKHGNWSYYPHLKGMVLENTPWSPYLVPLKDFSTKTDFISTLLHLQSKRKERFPKDFDWSEMPCAFEIDNLLILLDKISRHYFKLAVQDLYREKSYSVDWNEALAD